MTFGTNRTSRGHRDQGRRAATPASRACGCRPARCDPSGADRSTPGEETTVNKWKTIVVGVDGSPGSRKALSWAAGEAADHGADLVVLNVWEHALLPPAGSVSVSERYVPDPSQATAEALLQIIKEELGAEPPVLVQPRVKQGRPAKVLIEDSADADLLGGGSRRHGGVAGLVPGPARQHVAAHPNSPASRVPRCAARR